MTDSGVRATHRMDAADADLDELGAALFASFRRNDQRTRGVAYLRGLLHTDGRKSIRNIATASGTLADEQRLHHFVSDSTWDWIPVRRALTGYLAHRLPPRAWVLRRLLIPKAGKQSVGVGRHFDQRLGQTLNVQQAIGVWASAAQSSYPLHWRLHLSGEWLTDHGRRRRASIPDTETAEPFDASMITTFLEATGWPESPTRPVVLDARDLGVVSIVHKLRAARIPLLVRIDDDTPVRSVLRTDLVPAARAMMAVRDTRRPISWPEPGPVPVTRSCLAAAVRVRLPDVESDLLLLGTAGLGQPWPDELWLTDLPATRPTGLVRLTTLLDRVDEDLTAIGDRVGLRDFSGRSFGGWHRHVTLASAAHALRVLSLPAHQTRHTG